MDKNSYTWNEWFTGSKRLTLNEGANLITYSVDADCTGNVHLDSLTMHLADVPYTQADIRPQSVRLEKDYAILKEGEGAQIQAGVVPENAGNQKLTYQSESEEVATVDEGGKVTAVKEGKTVVTVSAVGNKEAVAQFTVFVTKKATVGPENPSNPDTPTTPDKTVIRPAYVELSAKEAALTPGKSKALNPKVYPAYAEDTSVSFQSSDPKVATVDAKGNVTAKASGTAVITATANGDKTVVQTCKITVTPAKVAGLKVSRVKKTGAVKLRWKKLSQVDGYQIFRSEKKNGTYKRIKTVKTASFTDKKAKKGKTYYYKVRAYKKVQGKNITGNASGVKKAKK